MEAIRAEDSLSNQAMGLYVGCKVLHSMLALGTQPLYPNFVRHVESLSDRVATVTWIGHSELVGWGSNSAGQYARITYCDGREWVTHVSMLERV